VKSLDILKRQESDGIIVKIIWGEDFENEKRLRRNIAQDFTIFDDKYVLTGVDELKMYQPPSKLIEEYIKVFETQKNMPSVLILFLPTKELI